MRNQSQPLDSRSRKIMATWECNSMLHQLCGVVPPTPRWFRVWMVVREYVVTLGKALVGRRVEEWECD